MCKTQPQNQTVFKEWNGARCNGGFSVIFVTCLKIRGVHWCIYTCMHLDVSLLGFPFGNDEIPEELFGPFKLRITIQHCVDLRFLSEVCL